MRLIDNIKKYLDGGPVKKPSIVSVSQENKNEFPYDGTSKYKGGYNLKRALELYKPDETGHLPSVDNTNGEWLKDKDYPTAWKEFQATQLNLDLNKEVGFPVQNEQGKLQYMKGYKDGGPIITNPTDAVTVVKPQLQPEIKKALTPIPKKISPFADYNEEQRQHNLNRVIVTGEPKPYRGTIETEKTNLTKKINSAYQDLPPGIQNMVDITPLGLVNPIAQIPSKTEKVYNDPTPENIADFGLNALAAVPALAELKGLKGVDGNAKRFLNDVTGFKSKQASHGLSQALKEKAKDELYTNIFDNISPRDDFRFDTWYQRNNNIINNLPTPRVTNEEISRLRHLRSDIEGTLRGEIIYPSERELARTTLNKINADKQSIINERARANRLNGIFQTEEEMPFYTDHEENVRRHLQNEATPSQRTLDLQRQIRDTQNSIRDNSLYRTSQAQRDVDNYFRHRNTQIRSTSNSFQNIINSVRNTISNISDFLDTPVSDIVQNAKAKIRNNEFVDLAEKLGTKEAEKLKNLKPDSFEVDGYIGYSSTNDPSIYSVKDKNSLIDTKNIDYDSDIVAYEKLRKLAKDNNGIVSRDIKKAIDHRLEDLHSTKFLQTKFRTENVREGFNPTIDGLQMYTSKNGQKHLVDTDGRIYGTLSAYEGDQHFDIGSTGVDSRYHGSSELGKQNNLGEALYRGAHHGYNNTHGKPLVTSGGFVSTTVEQGGVNVTRKRAQDFWDKQIDQRQNAISGKSVGDNSFYAKIVRTGVPLGIGLGVYENNK